LITDDFSSTESQPTIAASRKRQHNLEEEEDPAEYDMERYADLDAEEEKLLFYIDDTGDRSSCIGNNSLAHTLLHSLEAFFFFLTNNLLSFFVFDVDDRGAQAATKETTLNGLQER
jgi:hypothetical protein